MKTKRSIFLAVILLGVAVSSHAQSASGIIDPSRMVDWSHAGVPGGIPNRSTICATLNPGATAAQINSAIASCSNGVVFLNAGTYNISDGGIDFANHSNVTLRGAGANQTFLIFSNTVSCGGLYPSICIENGDGNWPGGPSNTASWTAGYSKNTTQIMLSNTNNIVPNSTFLALDQLDDTTDTGQIYVCQTAGVCSHDGGSNDRSGRLQSQLVLVTGVSGNTVTISPGLYMPNWRASQTPGAWWGNNVVRGDGVENLSLDNTNNGGTSGIAMFNAYGCWVQGIRSIRSNRSHVWFYLALKSTVRDSYFYGTVNAAPSSYGIESLISSDNLEENNIFQQVTTPNMMNGSASGTVVGYNFSIDDLYLTSANWMVPADALHDGGEDNILFESNESNGLIGDDVHGTHNFITAFRNQYIGWEVNKTSQTNPITAAFGSRYFNIIGNVLGKAGYQTNYNSFPPTDSGNEPVSIYDFGWWDYNGGSSQGPSDFNVLPTTMRWGNYDAATNTVRFVSSEVPSGLSAYANPVPSSQSLPPSFYLSSKPSWWGTVPFPAIGPDVSGGTDTSGHVYPNPAKSCYTSIMGGPADGSGNVLNFNPSSCYTVLSSLAPPLPPTNLQAVPQ